MVKSVVTCSPITALWNTLVTRATPLLDLRSVFVKLTKPGLDLYLGAYVSCVLRRQNVGSAHSPV